MPSNRAFTLLELLVVITIIGILSSIVIVSMSGSTDSATIAKGKAYAQQVHALLGANAVGAWNFDEGTANTCSGGEDVCDISGYGNHGTFYGDTQFVSSDIDGYALSFDGTGDYVDCGDEDRLNINNEITIEVWSNRPASSVDIYPRIISKGLSANDGYQLMMGQNLDLLRWEIEGLTPVYKEKSYSFLENQWYHIILTYSGDNVILYINGILIDNTAVSGTIVKNQNNLEIGRRGDNARYFNGLIDDVRIYSEALPSIEIQKHYVQGLNKLLANNVITQIEYDQRMQEFNKSLASK